MSHRESSKPSTVTPLVSVVIPTYRRPTQLRRAVASVLNQTYANFEILVVNDDVDDPQLGGFADEYHLPNLFVLRNVRTKGGNGARNTGILRAQGSIIALLDDDDEWLPDKLQRQVAALAARGGNWGVVYCGYDIRDGGHWRRVTRLQEGQFVRDYLLQQNSVGSSSTLMFRKAVVEEVGLFNEDLSRYQDREFVIRMMRSYNFSFVPSSLVRVYGHNPPPAAKAETARQKFLELVAEDVQQLGDADRLLLFAKIYRELSTLFYKEGNVSRGWFYLKSSMRSRILFPTRYANVIAGFIEGKTGISMMSGWSRLKGKLRSHRIVGRLLQKIS